ncbi:chemotaxis protein CheW [Desulfoluna sp.]|uniref:chemotaxis protein CheW n=1 Tax=Desulfoluna sp. TaxID=2045199 RepID=UPI002639BF68|nr:chemotaxis protein CheW [Desulfoluna sp.]
MPKYLSFAVGGLNLGVAMTSVVSIEQGEPASWNEKRPLRLGSVSHESKTVPLYNTSLLMGEGGLLPDAAVDSKIVIVRFEGGTLALSVDRISGVMEGSEADVSEMPPVFSGLAKEVFPQVLRGAEGWVPLIHPAAVERAVFSAQMKRVEPDAERDIPVDEPDLLAPEPASMAEADVSETAFSLEWVDAADEPDLMAMAALADEPEAMAEADVSETAFSLEWADAADEPDLMAMAALADEPAAMAEADVSETAFSLDWVDAADEPDLMAMAALADEPEAMAEAEVSENDFIAEEDESAMTAAFSSRAHFKFAPDETVDVETEVSPAVDGWGDAASEREPLETAAPVLPPGTEPLGGFSAALEKALTPELLERVVQRVVGSMMKTFVSDLTSDVSESLSRQDVALEKSNP